MSIIIVGKSVADDERLRTVAPQGLTAVVRLLHELLVLQEL